MGLFGRKPRMVGFGGAQGQQAARPKPRRRAGSATGEAHREGQRASTGGPWSDAGAKQGSGDLRRQISELKEQAPAIGNMVERLARKGPAGMASISTDISRIFWRVMWIFVLLVFVFPIIGAIVTAFIPD